MADLPIPPHHWPRTERELGTLGERLGGRASLRISMKRVSRRVKGERAPRLAPEFMEWWLSFSVEFLLPRPTPPDPANDRVRDLLATTARIAAAAWAKEIRTAKGWDPEPQPQFVATGGEPAPFLPQASTGKEER